MDKNKSLVNTLRNNLGSISAIRKNELVKIAQSIQELIKLKGKADIIFICTHNSRRSTLAQVILNTLLDSLKIPNIYCFSGGTEATAFNYRMVDALRKEGFDFKCIEEGENPKLVLNENPLSSQIYFSKKYESEPNPTNDFIAVMVCDQADEACPFVIGAFNKMPLTYKDPKAYDDTERESEMYSEKIKEIGSEMLFLAELLQKP